MTLKNLFRRILPGGAWGAGKTVQPDVPPERLPPGIEMGAAGPQDKEFVIRLADGTYYAGPGAAPGEIERTSMAGRAQRFPSRWAALQAATQGPVFAHAIILRVEDPR